MTKPIKYRILKYKQLYVAKYRSLVLAGAGALAYGLFAMPASAENSLIDVSKIVNDAHDQIFRAIVFVGPQKGVVSFRRPMKEKDLPDIGCKYDLNRPAVGPLIDIIAAQHLEEDSGNSNDLDARIGIYLYARDGSVMKLIIEEPFPNDSAHGTYNDTMGITAKPQFTKTLRAFFGKMEPAVSNYPCELDRSTHER